VHERYRQTNRRQTVGRQNLNMSSRSLKSDQQTIYSHSFSRRFSSAEHVTLDLLIGCFLHRSILSEQTKTFIFNNRTMLSRMPDCPILSTCLGHRLMHLFLSL